MLKYQDTEDRIHDPYTALVQSPLEEEGTGLTRTSGISRTMHRKLLAAALFHSSLLEITSNTEGIHYSMANCWPRVASEIIKESFWHNIGYFQQLVFFCVKPHVVPYKLHSILLSPGQIVLMLPFRCHQPLPHFPLRYHHLSHIHFLILHLLSPLPSFSSLPPPDALECLDQSPPPSSTLSSSHRGELLQPYSRKYNAAGVSWPVQNWSETRLLEGHWLVRITFLFPDIWGREYMFNGDQSCILCGHHFDYLQEL